MPYIVVTEFESSGESTCKIMGMTAQNVNDLNTDLTNANLRSYNHKEYFEVDVQGVQLLNFLNKQGFRVVSQSMAIEYTKIGGTNVKIQRIVWTLCKDQ